MQDNRERFRFSVEDYEHMTASGILSENDGVELIHGEIFEKMAIGPDHNACVARLNRLFNNMAGESALVWIQSSIRLSDSEPEPDVALLRPRDDFYASGNPEAGDVLLLIEVADTTLDFDRDVKGPMYASDAIKEYWIINLIENCIEVRRQPAAEAGAYGELQICKRGDGIGLSALPELVVSVEQILSQEN